MDDDAVFVDQAALYELGGQRRACDAQLAGEFGPQPRQHVIHIAAHEPAVPIDVVEACREDDLRRRVPDPGEVDYVLGRRREGLRRRPEGVHDLIDPPPVKERIRFSGAVAKPAVELFVDHGPIEGVVGSLDVAVERDVHQVDQLAHRRLRFGGYRMAHRNLRNRTSPRRRCPARGGESATQWPSTGGPPATRTVLAIARGRARKGARRPQSGR